MTRNGIKTQDMHVYLFPTLLRTHMPTFALSTPTRTHTHEYLYSRFVEAQNEIRAWPIF